ncbi:MAG: PqiC family protein [Candidatus Omnitrophica bacterium]|nr:PqiC family protein [Candidatus Omnitrophota bacterium]
MRKINFLSCAALVLFALILNGCVAVSGSPNPRFYMPAPISQQETVQAIDVPLGTIIAVGPIWIPGYLDRPQIVTRDKHGNFHFAQFDRWAEPLDSALARLINENLARLLPAASIQLFPCSFAIPLDYQVILEIVKLDSELDKDMNLTAQWSIINAKSRKLLLTKRSQFIQPINPHDYYGLTQALNTACAALSREIAGKLAEFANQPKIQEGVK